MTLLRRRLVTFTAIVGFAGIALVHGASTITPDGRPGAGAAGVSLQKCSRRLLELMAGAETAETVTVWIFFVDRGLVPVERGDEHRFSRRAAERRSLRASTGMDLSDLPVERGYIDAVRRDVIRVRHVSRYFNAVSAEIEISRIPAIGSLPFVEYIDRIAVFRKTADIDSDSFEPVIRSDDPLSGTYGGSFDQLNQIRSTDLLELGYNGSGSREGNDPILICVMDTGFRLDHEALRHLDVVAQYDFVQYDSVTSNEEGDPAEQDRHGTLVLGALAGYEKGELVGPAWGAEFLLAKTEISDDEIEIEEDKWVAGVEWADSAGADIVSSSLGYFDWYTPDMLDGDTPLCTKAADIAAGHGVLVVTAVGNQGIYGDTTLIAPADGDSVIAVGAVDRYGTRAYFSSRGPAADGRTKPDLMALGRGVYTVEWGTSDGYMRGDGTSLATPLVAGLCAQILEIDPAMAPMDVREALITTSSQSGEPDNLYGYGIPDGIRASGLDAPPRPATIVLEGAYPNPFRSSTRFDIYIPEDDPLTVRVYDCRGALVKSLISDRILPWGGTLTWDGTNDAGRRVATGLYFMRFRSPKSDRTVKVLLVQ